MSNLALPQNVVLRLLKSMKQNKMLLRIREREKTLLLKEGELHYLGRQQEKKKSAVIFKVLKQYL